MIAAFVAHCPGRDLSGTNTWLIFAGTRLAPAPLPYKSCCGPALGSLWDDFFELRVNLNHRKRIAFAIFFECQPQINFLFFASARYDPLESECCRVTVRDVYKIVIADSWRNHRPNCLDRI